MQVRAGSRIQVRGSLRQDSWVDKHTGERQWMVKVGGAGQVGMPESEGAMACHASTCAVVWLSAGDQATSCQAPSAEGRALC